MQECCGKVAQLLHDENVRPPGDRSIKESLLKDGSHFQAELLLKAPGIEAEQPGIQADKKKMRGGQDSS